MEEYNKIPVYYCRDCLSLRIKATLDQLNYCDECGSADIDTTMIDDWVTLYEAKYNYKYLDQNGRG